MPTWTNKSWRPSKETGRRLLSLPAPPFHFACSSRVCVRMYAVSVSRIPYGTVRLTCTNKPQQCALKRANKSEERSPTPRGLLSPGLTMTWVCGLSCSVRWGFVRSVRLILGNESFGGRDWVVKLLWVELTKFMYVLARSKKKKKGCYVRWHSDFFMYSRLHVTFRRPLSRSTFETRGEKYVRKVGNLLLMWWDCDDRRHDLSCHCY
jgi:hypothetical protein